MQEAPRHWHVRTLFISNLIMQIVNALCSLTTLFISSKFSSFHHNYSQFSFALLQAEAPFSYWPPPSTCQFYWQYLYPLPATSPCLLGDINIPTATKNPTTKIRSRRFRYPLQTLLSRRVSKLQIYVWERYRVDLAPDKRSNRRYLLPARYQYHGKKLSRLNGLWFMGPSSRDNRIYCCLWRCSRDGNGQRPDTLSPYYNLPSHSCSFSSQLPVNIVVLSICFLGHFGLIYGTTNYPH